MENKKFTFVMEMTRTAKITVANHNEAYILKRDGESKQACMNRILEKGLAEERKAMEDGK